MAVPSTCQKPDSEKSRPTGVRYLLENLNMNPIEFTTFLFEQARRGTVSKNDMNSFPIPKILFFFVVFFGNWMQLKGCDWALAILWCPFFIKNNKDFYMIDYETEKNVHENGISRGCRHPILWTNGKKILRWPVAKPIFTGQRINSFSI